MRRIVDQVSNDRRTFLGRPTALGLPLLLWLTSLSMAGDGDLPALLPPGEMPIVSKPSTVPDLKPTVTSTPRRAVLALPGLTTPSSRPLVSAEAPKPSIDPGPASGELTLDAPIEMKPLPDSSRLSPGSTSSRPGRPLVLESSTMEEPLPESGDVSRSKPSSRRTTVTPPPPLQQARRPRFFGLLPAPAQVRTPTPAPKPSTGPPGRSVAESLPDDAAESALKRRIERQAREVVGIRGRSVEVKVANKEAVIHVEGVKFYQRRALRKQLEGIPALTGLRSTIEVVD